MNKNKALAVISVLIYSAILLLLYKTLYAFEDAENMLCYFAKCASLGLLISVMIIGFICIIMFHEAISPYCRKFAKFRYLLYQLVRRDFLAKYKRSVLGIMWSFLNPLFMMTIMVIVFSNVFRFDIANFPVYVLSGQIVFSLFNEATTSAMASIIGNASLIKKVSLPRYIFPLSKVMSALINFLFSLVALLLVMVFTKTSVHLSALVVPLPVLYVFVFALGIGLFLSAEQVFFRDVGYLYNLLIFAASYFTPLFYPISIIPDKYRWIVFFNPLYHYVSIFRTVVLDGQFPSLWQHIVCILLSLTSLIMGMYAFFRKQDRFILYI